MCSSDLLFVGATGYVQGAEIITTATFATALGTSLETKTFTATYITMNPNEVLVSNVGTTTTYGTYNFGSLTDITTYGDYNTVAQTGYYSVNDASGAPGHVEYIGFGNVLEFNRAVFNINYTTASGHTVDIDLYNYDTDSWDTFTTYSGSGNWQQFALGLIDHRPYVSAANSVTTRIYHVSSGNTSHRTWIDYVALEQSTTGGQGPRGATGATGATGPQGVNSGTNSTFVITNTSATYSTSSGALQVAGGVGIAGSAFVGGVVTATTFIGDLTGTASTATSAATAYALANTATTYVYRATLADTATTATSAATAYSWLGGTVSNPVTFASNVTFSGSATYVNSTATLYTDNILELHTPPGGMDDVWFVDDGKDIGFHLHYYKNGTDTNAALLLRNDSKYLEWFQDGSDSTSNGNSFTATTYGTFKTGSIILANTTATASTTTGALQVAGGIGVGGDMYIGGVATATNFYVGPWAVSTASALTIQGFGSTLGTAGTINFATGTTATLVGGVVTIQATATGADTLQLVTSRGATTDQAISITNNTNVTSTSTGALIVRGGLGVGGGGYFGGTVTATNFIGNITGSVSQVLTTAQSASADYYLTFVDANNASATTETVYTTSTFTINPGTGAVSVGGNMYVGGSVVAGNLLDSGKALALAMGMAMP